MFNREHAIVNLNIIYINYMANCSVLSRGKAWTDDRYQNEIVNISQLWWNVLKIGLITGFFENNQASPSEEFAGSLTHSRMM